MPTRRIRPRLLLALLLPTLFATTPAWAADLVLVERPDPGTEEVRDVGDPIYWISDQQTALVLTEPFRDPIRKNLVAEVPAGTVLTEWAQQRPGWFCSPEDAPMITGSMLGFDIAEPICFRDADSDGRFEAYFVGPGGTRGSGSVAIEIEGGGPAYRESTAAHEGSFRRELVFLGVDGSTLRMQYREFRGEFVRPAFDQLLTYRLRGDGGSVIRFRGLEIRVVAAEEGRIRYTLVSGVQR